MSVKEGSVRAESDAESMIDRLKEQYRNGFLTKEEFESRLLSALAASGSLRSLLSYKVPEDMAAPGKHPVHLYQSYALVTVDFPSASEKDGLLHAL